MNKKYNWILSSLALIIITIIFGVGTLLAKSTPNVFTDQFRLPEKAKAVAPGVYYLGKAVDKGRSVEGYAFVDYKKAHVKPGTVCGNGICEPGENARKCPADCGGK